MRAHALPLAVALLVLPAAANADRDAVARELAGLEPAAPSESWLLMPDPAAREQALALLGSTGLLLIPDSTNDRIMAFDPATGNIVDADFVPSDPAHLGTGIHAVLNTCNLPAIQISDQINDVVHTYDLDGNYVGTFAPAGGPNTSILDNIRGVWNEQGYGFLVTVGGGTNADAVAMFFPDTGASAGNFISNGLGGLASPFSVMVRCRCRTSWSPASTATPSTATARKAPRSGRSPRSTTSPSRSLSPPTATC
ncbi:MAG: hypothetical protein F9K16_10825 [Thermoanaerobaculia bacterium]|nr:MAG: hypothetical protein F9K16_10825 [Thermoanaerobaculia bacterium]